MSSETQDFVDLLHQRGQFRYFWSREGTDSKKIPRQGRINRYAERSSIGGIEKGNTLESHVYRFKGGKLDGLQSFGNNRLNRTKNSEGLYDGFDAEWVDNYYSPAIINGNIVGLQSGEKGFQDKTDKRQERAKKKTQMRLQARIKLKDSKVLQGIPAFKMLNKEEVDIIIETMDHIVRYKGDLICRQHDVSDSFYIIVRGDCIVTVDVEQVEGQGETKIKEEDEDVEDESMQPEQKEVAQLCSLKYFGESALLVDETEAFRNATVLVSSDKCDLLRLKKSSFIKLNETNKDMFNKTDTESNKSTMDLLKEERAGYLERRKSLMLGMGGGGSGGGGIRPKGLPINLGGLKTKNQRSLFS